MSFSSLANFRKRQPCVSSVPSGCMSWFVLQTYGPADDRGIIGFLLESTTRAVPVFEFSGACRLAEDGDSEAA